MSGNSGAWGIAMWKDGRGTDLLLPHEDGISLEGGDPIVPYLPTDPLGCLLVPPVGMGVPPVRNGDVAFAQRDGVIQFGDYYEARQITFQVLLQNEGCPGCPTVRQRVSRLTEEWSRNCDGATLVIFTDCHDPDATEAEKIYLGPYLVHGRPRVAEVTWLRSNIGAARVTLRFDADDARLELAMTPEGGNWHAGHTVDAEAGAAGGGNIHPNYRLEGLTMTLNGGTMTDNHFSSGAPDGGSFFHRDVVVPNVSSPMTMETTPTGTGAIPVSAGTSYTVSWWAEKSVVGGPSTRVNMRWFDAGGATLSTTSGTNMSAATAWGRHSETFVAPVGAAFLMPILAWSGIALAGQALSLAQIWVNQGVVATGPSEIEIVGTLCAYLTITLFGSLTAPITVTYGSHEFTYNEDIPALGAASVVVDTRWGRASTITVDTTQELSGDYTSPLEPGTHDLTVTTGNPADTGSVRAEWTNAVVSG